MKKTLLCASALAVLSMASVAVAETGWYGKLDLGYTFDGKSDIDITAANQAAQVGGLDASPGHSSEVTGGFGLGYKFGNGWRVEGEIFRHATNYANGEFTAADTLGITNPVLATRLNPANAGQANSLVRLERGSATAWTAMLNGLYDFNNLGPAQPYVGAGLGLARVSGDVSSLFVRQGGTAFNGYDDSDLSYGGQLLAGVGFKVQPQLTLDLGYRYFIAPDLEFQGRNNQNYEGTYQDHTVTAGLRWQFAAPPPPVVTPPPVVVTPPPPPPVVVTPPPPPPVPPPVVVNPPVVTPVCVNTNAVVYFDWDKSTLTNDAVNVIDRAVADARNCLPTSIIIEGHADRSGSSRYNVGLSASRAAVVKAALEARGIASTIISTSAAGEGKPAVQTPDGVREPLNRRSEITIIVR
jgi:outer membrane protein OmpA-like peptidoglycan-associated protein